MIRDIQEEILKLKKEKKLDLDSEIKSYDITEDEKIKILKMHGPKSE